jgi:hypothetical protein
MLAGPGSAARSYHQALGLYGDLDIPRRIAQIELSLAVVTEMTGQHQDAARHYARPLMINGSAPETAPGPRCGSGPRSAKTVSTTTPCA